MKSTNERMARGGVRNPANDALAILIGLLAVITAGKPRFGIIRNDFDAVVGEPCESIEYAKKASELGAHFNVSVVMGI